MNRSVLLQRLQSVYQRLVLGDPALTRKVAEWKRLAKAGHPRAKVVYNSLAVLHWRRRDTMAFAHAEVFYNRLRAYDRRAHAELRQLVERKNAGDAKAKALFSTLKAVHHKRKASLWSNGPGAPQTGYHPMPSHHRVGIDIPGALNQFGQYGQQWLGGGQYPQPQAQMFLPLTPQAVAMLVQLIRQVIAGMGGGFVRSLNPDDLDMSPRMMDDAGPAPFSPQFEGEFKPRIVTTTPRAKTSSTVIQPKLSTTVSLSAPTTQNVKLARELLYPTVR